MMKTYFLTKPTNLRCIILLFVLLCSSDLFGQMTRSEIFSDSKLGVSEATLKDGSEYCRITYDNLQFLNEIGKPELPVKYVKLLIPATESVSGITLTKKVINKIDIVKKITPAQPCLPISDDQPYPFGWNFFCPCPTNSHAYLFLTINLIRNSASLMN